MQSGRALSLACLFWIPPMLNVHCSTILTVITPGPRSHAMGLIKVHSELAERGHSMTVSTAE